MRVYIVAVDYGVYEGFSEPWAAFSTRDYAQAYIDTNPEGLSDELTITELEIDKLLKPEERRVNAPIVRPSAPDARPDENCMLTGSPARRGQVEGFPNPANVTVSRDCFQVTGLTVRQFIEREENGI